MENLLPDDERAEELDEAIAQFTSALAQVKVDRLAERASEKFLKEFSRELSADRQMGLLLKALVVCLRSYTEQRRVDPKLELLLQDWWGNAAFQELRQALSLFERTAESRGAANERRKILTALPHLIEQRLPQGEHHGVVVYQRLKVMKRSAISIFGPAFWIPSLVFVLCATFNLIQYLPLVKAFCD